MRRPAKTSYGLDPFQSFFKGDVLPVESPEQENEFCVDCPTSRPETLAPRKRWNTPSFRSSGFISDRRAADARITHARRSRWRQQRQDHSLATSTTGSPTARALRSRAGCELRCYNDAKGFPANRFRRYGNCTHRLNLVSTGERHLCRSAVNRRQPFGIAGRRKNLRGGSCLSGGKRTRAKLLSCRETLFGPETRGQVRRRA